VTGGEAKAEGVRARSERGERDPLAQYFRDLAGASRPLGRDAELRLALELQERHGELWARLLSHAPIAVPLLDVAIALRPDLAAVLRPLRRAAASAAGRRTREARLRLERLARDRGPALWARDRDRRLLDALAREVDRIATPVPGGRVAFERYRRAFAAARARAEQVRHELARRNLRLVVSEARRNQRSGVALADLIQDGNLGLLTAVDRYDVARGFRFATYATWWIRHAIQRAIVDRGYLIRVPAHVALTRARVGRARQRLTAELARAPTIEELAGATELSQQRVTMALQREQRTSIDRPTSDETDRGLHETLADPRAGEDATAAMLLRGQQRAQLDRALGRLKPIEALVLRERFGIDDEEETRTLREIGAEHGLSRERIRQIEAEALRKLRRLLEAAEAPRPPGARLAK
jgi:RNA polymerase primary sigma factor